MAIYRELTTVGVSTRAAARLTGVSRATATRKPRPLTPQVVSVPANKLSHIERARILRLVNSDRFVDLPPIQIWTQLPDETTLVQVE